MKVYLIGDDQGNFKIGISNNPAKRIRSLNNPRELRVLYELELNEFIEPHRIEYLLHEFYRDRRIRGEWFECIDVNDFALQALKFARALMDIYALSQNWEVPQ